MLKYSVINTINTNKPNLALKYCQNTLLMVNNENILSVFNDKTEFEYKTQLLKKQEPRHPYCSAYSIANKTLSVPKEKATILAKFDNNKITPKFKNELHQHEIMLTHFCDTGEYLLSSCAGGKTYLLETQTQAVRYRFANNPDYCSYVSFSPRNIFIFLAYHNGQNILLNLSNDHLYTIKHDVPIYGATFFDDDKKLFFYDKKGLSTIFDCVTYKIISQELLFQEWVTSLVLSQNKQFAILGTRTNRLYIVDLYKNRIKKEIKLDNSGITCLERHKEKLYLSFYNGIVDTVDLNYKLDEFKTYMSLKEYHKAKEALKNNLFLYINSDIQSFYDAFEEIYLEAENLIVKKQTKKIKELFKPFMQEEELKERIDMLFRQQERILAFTEAFEQKNIEKAYAIAKSHEIITTLSTYKTLEKQWQSSFVAARRVLEADSATGKRRAQEILEPYKNVSQKEELISSLLNNAEKFYEADECIKKQDFACYFALVEKHSFLKGTFLHQKVEVLALSIQANAAFAYMKKDYLLAKDTYKKLLHFVSFKSAAQKEIDKIDKHINLQEYINYNDMQEVYTLVEQSSNLQFDDSFIKYNEKFEESISKASLQAQKGSLKRAVSLLSFYFEVPSLKDKLDNCLKQGYQRELKETHLNVDKVSVALKNYKSLFGLDEQSREIFTKKGYEKEYKEILNSELQEKTKPYPFTIFETNAC